MRIELKYFTGTGNSLKILDTCREVFVEAGHLAQISEIHPDETNIRESDILGFCFPVYQSFGGDTRGKNRYHEPGFKPRKL